jgi:hypothetical protein
LTELRNTTGQSIPLAWEPTDVTDVAAIEVYPAATLRIRGISTFGYKKKGQIAARDAIVRALAPLARLPQDSSRLAVCADALDGAICVLAGADFLRGECFVPDDLATAKREGWIWVRERRSANSVPHA